MAKHEAVLSAAIAVVAAGAGDNQVVAAPGVGKKIRVLGYAFVVSAAGVNPKWRSAANDRTGALPLAANGGISVPIAPPDFNDPRGKGGWFECGTNEALNINVAAAGNVGGHVLYQIVSA